MLGDDPIDLRERLAADIDSPVHGQVLLAASAELAGENFLRPPAHAMGEIFAVDSEFIAVPVDAAHDDVNVRVVGVVVVHRRPDETTPGVLFDLAHELPGQFRQVDTRAILRRDDESKLPFLVRDAVREIPRR